MLKISPTFTKGWIRLQDGICGKLFPEWFKEELARRRAKGPLSF